MVFYESANEFRAAFKNLEFTENGNVVVKENSIDEIYVPFSLREKLRTGCKINFFYFKVF